ncbi:hypothetical protein Hypma_010542 [Hypsizygus marmoreus]|uniref:Uncharacterized protein n=1 Tax=Hypsizygus marmoreus TaxID=39966 RepID=A0A369JUB5_HYPMA|nr:hypothetical protein Hypma_010542 [Hypsizygus marmoreus]
MLLCSDVDNRTMIKTKVKTAKLNALVALHAKLDEREERHPGGGVQHYWEDISGLRLSGNFPESAADMLLSKNVMATSNN